MAKRKVAQLLESAIARSKEPSLTPALIRERARLAQIQLSAIQAQLLMLKAGAEAMDEPSNTRIEPLHLSMAINALLPRCDELYDRLDTMESPEPATEVSHG